MNTPVHTESGWIRCTDKMPNRYEPVLVAVPAETPGQPHIVPFALMEFSHGYWQVYNTPVRYGYEVTHWRRMPDGPRTDENGVKP